MPHATADDVKARLGRPLTDDETSLAEVRIADAERMILRRIPDLEDKILAGDVAEEDVVQVEADAVCRILRNPDGYTSETDGTYSYAMKWDVASGKLEILDSEWKTLGITSGPISWFKPFGSPWWMQSPNPGVHPFTFGG